MNIKSNTRIPFPTGHYKILELLLKNGADPNQRTGHGATVLHAAAIRGSNDIVQLLIENGADVNVQDDSERTPLYWSVMKSTRWAFFIFIFAQILLFFILRRK